jgi:hypothetical protein
VTTRRKPKLGRPPSAKPRGITKRVRVTADELADQLALANKQNQTWSDLAREALGLAVARGSSR